MKPEEACRKLGCKEDMYCFGGKDKTIDPPLCSEAQELVKEDDKVGKKTD